MTADLQADLAANLTQARADIDQAWGLGEGDEPDDSIPCDGCGDPTPDPTRCDHDMECCPECVESYAYPQCAVDGAAERWDETRNER